MKKISASLLSCDLLNLEKEINTLYMAGIDSIHIDVMDGIFVDNIAFGLDTIKHIDKISKIPIHVHLMVENPLHLIDRISLNNVEYIMVHHNHNNKEPFEKTINKIKNNGILAGLAINPNTQINNEILDYLDIVDLGLVMGVYPGFGGQKLITSTLEKINQIKDYKKSIIIAVDGGINDKTINLANKTKADILIAGSYLFLEENNYKDRLNSIKEKLKILCQQY